MANLPITSAPLPSPSTGNAPSSSQKNGTPNAKPAEQFGSVLARQIDNTNPSSPNVSTPAEGNSVQPDAKSQTTNSDTAKIKAEQEKALAAADQLASNTPIDPAAALVAMLQLPKELKTPAAKVATDKSTPDTAAPTGTLIAMLQPSQDIQTKFTKDAASDTAATRPTANIGKTAGNTLSTNLGATQANMASAASDKTDAAITAADKLALHAEARLAQGKAVELPNNQTSTTQQPAQNITPSATSGIASNMLTPGKLADNPQSIAAPLGSNGWADEFSQKISWMSTQKNQVAELHLNPPDLGPLDVTLKISDNQATAMFTSPHSAVRDAIENALPKLREILADNGIMLGNATVSDQTPRDGNSAGFMNQRGDSTASREISGLEVGQTNSSASTLQTTPARRHNGMVDTFA